MRILCTGDLHIGRRPSRLPGNASAAHSCAAIWAAIVDTAVARGVDLVAISGDLVDRSNRFFEASAPLADGLRRLAQSGIQTVLVAGNHDHDVLPRLVDAVGTPLVRLLGRGGRWERCTIRGAEHAVHVDGWSFPQEHVTRCPLDDYRAAAPDGVPVLGLLHADLGQTTSHYAPVTLPALRQAGCAFWLLGHIHARALHDEHATAPVLYPGSPQPMDPGEAGGHGASVLTLRPGERPTVEHLSLATVRYDTVTLSLDGQTDSSIIETLALQALESHLDAVLATGHAPAWLSCRLRLIGRCALRGEVERQLAPLLEYAPVVRDGATLCVERVDVALTQPVDLEELARASDAPGLLARLILALDADALDARETAFLRDACGRVADVGQLKSYRGLTPVDDESGDRIARDALRRHADALLGQLLATRSPA